MNTRPIIVDVAILAMILCVLFYILHLRGAESPFNVAQYATSTQSAASAAASSTPSTSAATSSPKSATSTVAGKRLNGGIKSASTSSEIVAARVERPYATAPESFDTINTAARSALVNVFCLPRGGGLKPISGSGTIIDPRGIVLTNAHVAQYVLLSEDPSVDLACFLRTGSPAATSWIPAVLYLPPVWVFAHASEIKVARPVGTGEHDYALLYIAGTANGTPLPSSFPFIPVDTRANIGFVDDQVLAASYPAEFQGNVASNLYAAASVTAIRELFTFGTTSVDAFSVGGVIEAQSGSSGGAIVNAWRRLIGVITTTSSGATTAERDLRAVSLNYIDRDIYEQTGRSLSAILSGDPSEETADFTRETAPKLVQQLINALTH